MNSNILQALWLKTSLLLLLLCAVDPLAAQQERLPVTLHFDQMPMRTVLDSIEVQSGLSFSYGSRLIDEQEPVTIHLSQVNLEEALGELFRNRKVVFKVVERQIVLKRARRLRVNVQASVVADSSGVLPVRFTVSGYVKDALNGEVLIGATVTIPGGW